MNFDTTSYSVSWFKDRYVEGTLIIAPPYQRRPVWGLRQKAKLIESILLDVPIPELFIDQTTDENGKSRFSIVDGQQRTRAVLQFVGLDNDPLEQEYNNFSLETLDKDSPWKDKTFKDLTGDERKHIFGYKFSIRNLYNASELELRDTFKRINEYLTKLNDQELRNATYSGPFVKLVAQAADDPFWSDNKFFSAANVRRMKDLQYTSELLIGLAYGPQGGSARAIDEHYSYFEEYEDEVPDQKDIWERFTFAIQFIRILFPEIDKAGRFKNTVDFYSLFIAIGALKKAGKAFPTSTKALTSLRTEVLEFSTQVDKSLTNPHTTGSTAARKYARAVEKGVTDKSRRAVRHEALLTVLEKHI